MKTSIEKRKKQLLALCLAAMMATSAGALVACTDSSDSSSSSSSSSSTTEEVKDTGLIKNAGFETFNTNDGLNLIGTSVTGWTRAVNSTTSGSALSSKSASGIIDVSAEKWADLTTNTVDDPTALTNEEAEAKWDTLTSKDKLEFYEAWEDREENDDLKISEELKSFYQSFNIDSEDLPTCKNPGTHYAEGDENADDTKLLMIHNAYESSSYKTLGTAQKYTSSSTVTVKAGTSAKFSVWVKTSDLKTSNTAGESQDAVGRGAYVSVTHTVGGKTMDAFQVKNINTEGVTENNGWVQYSFYLRGTTYSDTTFTVVLGLGQGGGTDRMEYVNGYAFFDDIQCETIDNETFDNETSDADLTVGFAETSKEKTIDAAESEANKFALDFYGEFENFSFLDTIGTPKPTTEKNTSGTTEYTAANGTEYPVYPGLGFDTTNDSVGKINLASLQNNSNKYLAKIYEDYFAEDDFLKGTDALLLMSANGAAYTAKSSYNFSVNAGEYLALSFYVKTSEMNGFTGAGITLHDGNNKTSISSIDTTTIAGVEVGDNEDIYDGWQQCLFFISNDTDDVETFSLSFTYGPTTVVGTTKSQYYAGFAAFAGFTMKNMDKSEFDSAASGTYAKLVSLQKDEIVAAGDSGFDTVAGVPTDAIKNGYANAQNYKGVTSESAYVKVGSNDTAINTLATAGLLNKEYVQIENEEGKKVENEKYTAILNTLGGSDWNSVFGNATQPLVIYNEKAQESAYGFIGTTTSIAASTYSTISLRVKTNGKAYVYLVDTDDDSRQSLLSVGRQVSFWYDENGNVCDSDPTDEHFNNKKHVAFKLQPNGLYKLNPEWRYAAESGIDANAYYANLANYEKDSEGNLIVAEGGVSYNYNSQWDNEGQDGIAFYAKDGKYYADRATQIEVNCLTSVAKLDARYEALETSEGLYFEIGNTNGKWATVTFYVHTGDTAKNYRLEVWSGSRDGKTLNDAGTYAIFDAYKPSDVDETSFGELIADRQSSIDTNDSLGLYFENAFSFYDSAKYLRYNETIDENEVGNSYESYVSTDYTSGVAYLKYSESLTYEAYADYALSEVTVTADATDDDTTTDDTEDDHDHSDTNIALLASSLVVAGVLIIVIAIIIIRKIVAWSRKKKAAKARAAANTKKDK